jgi:hypothetical protein
MPSVALKAATTKTNKVLLAFRASFREELKI